PAECVSHRDESSTAARSPGRPAGPWLACRGSSTSHTGPDPVVRLTFKGQTETGLSYTRGGWFHCATSIPVAFVTTQYGIADGIILRNFFILTLTTKSDRTRRFPI